MELSRKALKPLIRVGPVPADADGGRVRNISGETHLVAPARFEAPAAGRDRAAATVRRRGLRRREPGGGHPRRFAAGSATAVTGSTR